VETNILFIDVSGTGRAAAEWQQLLAAEGLLVTILGGRVRMLTHVGIGSDEIQAALAAWRRAAKTA
jgi:threonine aldolase